MNILLAVDVQPEFRDEDGQYERIVDFIKTTKDYDKIVATKFVNFPNSNFVKYLNWTDCMIILKDLEFNCNFIMLKDGYGSTDYSALSRKDHIDIIGFNTGACVLKVALDLFDRKYDISVLSDYCYSSDGREKHELGLKVLRNLLGDAVK